MRGYLVLFAFASSFENRTVCFAISLYDSMSHMHTSDLFWEWHFCETFSEAFWLGSYVSCDPLHPNLQLNHAKYGVTIEWNQSPAITYELAFGMFAVEFEFKVLATFALKNSPPPTSSTAFLWILVVQLVSSGWRQGHTIMNKFIYVVFLNFKSIEGCPKVAVIWNAVLLKRWNKVMSLV